MVKPLIPGDENGSRIARREEKNDAFQKKNT
jgi:hypothetical protein